MSNNKSPIFNWPENPNGEPLKLVTTSYEEPIPTVKLSSTFTATVKMFASVTEFTDEPQETIDKNQKVIEVGLSKTREEILEALDKE